VSFHSWLENTSYTRRKKDALSKLYQETCLLVGPKTATYKVVVCFIKNEAYIIYKAPRAILARSDEFKVRVGPIFKVIENKLFAVKASYGQPYFIKKIPIPDRPKVILDTLGSGFCFTDRPNECLRRALVTDYSQFEASFVEEVMEALEIPFYYFMAENLPEFHEFKLCVDELTGINTCVFRNWKFKIRSRRMSGEMNTSLGNGFSNLMISLFSCYYHKCSDIRIFVEGDDCVCTYVGPIIPSTFVEKLGFIVKMTYLSSPSLASFCGQVFDLETLVVITDPIKIILNFAWMNMKYLYSADYIKKGLLRSRALSLLYQYSGCPIVQKFSERFIYITRDYLPIVDETDDRYHQELMRDILRMKIVSRPVSFQSRELMFSVFQIPIVVQLQLEKYFAEYDFGVINCPQILNYVNDDMVHNYNNYVRQLYKINSRYEFL
jgi:hypothetical protein